MIIISYRRDSMDRQDNVIYLETIQIVYHPKTDVFSGEFFRSSKEW